MHTPVTLFRIFLFFSAIPIIAETTFLANYDDSLNANFAKGNPEAFIEPDVKKGDVKLVTSGHFGSGVYIGRKIPAMALNYLLEKNLDPKNGTIEFWFRPEWNSKFIEKDGPAWLKGGTLVPFFSTSGITTKLFLGKNQYNSLVFHYVRSYQALGTVWLNGNFWKTDHWDFYAVSWDTEEARLFFNGKLIAVSEKWSVIEGGIGENFTLGNISYGTSGAAYGTFDDLRISNVKRYISSFPIPESPLKVIKKAAKYKPLPELTASEKQLFENKKILFMVEVKNGLTAKFAKGSPNFYSNKKLEIKTVNESVAVALKQNSQKCSDTLCYTTKGNFNQLLGQAFIEVSWEKLPAEPIVLIDFSRLVIAPGRSSNRYDFRTGRRLLLNKDLSLELQTLEGKKIISSVKSQPVNLTENNWTSLGFGWCGSKIILYKDSKPLITQIGVPFPSEYSKYMFFGSDSRALNSINGWVRKIEIKIK